jgi:hypothetical protein
MIRLALLIAFVCALAPQQAPITARLSTSIAWPTCPAAQHPASWHPPIATGGRADCSFDHEHGSNPDLWQIGYRTDFGAAARAAGMAEPHVGYKVFVVDTPPVRWLIVAHLGSSGPGRLCARFHSLHIAARDLVTGELLADTHRLADFGAAKRHPSGEALAPAACPTQAQDAAGSSGVRMFGDGYEPWRVDMRSDVTGVDLTGLVIHTSMAMTQLDAAGSLVATGRAGTYRALTLPQATIRPGPGAFCTDPYARAIIDCAAPGAVAQYVGATGYVLPRGLLCEPTDPYSQLYQCAESRASLTTPRYSYGSWQLGPIGPDN